jgi:hypothetical protein
VCLWDHEGPCGNPVKDSQRTKTAESTRRTLSVIWACKGEENALEIAREWYEQLLAAAGCLVVHATRPVAGGATQ